MHLDSTVGRIDRFVTHHHVKVSGRRLLFLCGPLPLRRSRLHALHRRRRRHGAALRRRVHTQRRGPLPVHVHAQTHVARGVRGLRRSQGPASPVAHTSPSRLVHVRHIQHSLRQRRQRACAAAQLAAACRRRRRQVVQMRAGRAEVTLHPRRVATDVHPHLEHRGMLQHGGHERRQHGGSGDAEHEATRGGGQLHHRHALRRTATVPRRGPLAVQRHHAPRARLLRARPPETQQRGERR